MRALDVTNEYYQFFNNKTTALCGLNDILSQEKSAFSDEIARKRAEKILLDITEDLANFSDEKKKFLNQD